MTQGLPDILTALRAALSQVDLSLGLPGAQTARGEVRALTREIDDYLLPRLARPDAPMLVVVGGSTGVGKSTLVNSLVRQPVSPAGVLRPTTRAPVLVHHPADESWFGGGEVLPHLPRADEAGGVAGALRLVSSWRVPTGLALLDAPDLDSVVALNRDLAVQLLAAADLWLFVTSAARYADAVPWEALRGARERDTALAVVLDRVPGGAEGTLQGELTMMLVEQHLGEAPVFTVAETPLDDEGLLPDSVIDSLRAWLISLTADQRVRAAKVSQSLSGALGALGPRVERVAVAMTAQDGACTRRRADVDSAYDDAFDAVGSALRDGSLLKGEVLARWQELVGSGRLMHGLEMPAGRRRDRLAAAVRSQGPPAAELELAIERGIEALVRGEADRASEMAFSAWWSSPDGRCLLEMLIADPGAAVMPVDLSRSSARLPERARRMAREWQSSVLELVRSQGVGRQRKARLLSFGVNGLGLLVMVATFAPTGGLAGTEGAPTAGTSVLGQRFLDALLGDQAIRRLADKARDDLQARVRLVLDDEAARFLVRLPESPVTTAALRDVVASVAALAPHPLRSEPSSPQTPVVQLGAEVGPEEARA